VEKARKEEMVFDLVEILQSTHQLKFYSAVKVRLRLYTAKTPYPSRLVSCCSLWVQNCAEILEIWRMQCQGECRALHIFDCPEDLDMA